VVLPALQHLRDEAFDATATAGEGRMEEEEPRAFFQRREGLGLRDAGDSFSYPAAGALNRRSIDLFSCRHGTLGRTAD
jgi:hypothetical protein